MYIITESSLSHYIISAHLAMIPEIGQTKQDRADLNSARYATSVVSNILVRTITWIIMDVDSKSEKNVTPADWWKFRVTRE